MSADTIEQRLQALRAGEPKVAEQLADLDAKLALWLETMQAGQDAIVRGVRELPVKATEPLVEPASLFDLTPKTEEVAPEADEPVATDSAETEEPVAEAPTGEPEEELDDDALLAQLDEDTATQVRVRRRLTGNRRSVREIVDEIRAEQKTEDSGNKKKSSWWSRGS